MADHSEAFISSIAETLNAAGVPCVLWGHCLLQAHGVPTIVDSIDFVVPDDQLAIAAKSLAVLKPLLPCPSGLGRLATCLASLPEPCAPPPAAHYHIDGTELTVGLFSQSDTLWFLASLDESLLSGAQGGEYMSRLPPCFCLASDSTVLPPRSRPGRGSGVYQPGDHPVVVPRSHVLLEAFLRLYARDSGKAVGSLGMAMISYMEEYVDDDGLLDAGQLPEPLRTFYQDLRLGKKPVRQWTRDLQEALGVPIEDSQDD